MKTEPQVQHDWLQKFVGEWTYDADCAMGPDQPHEKSTGMESVRPLGGLWVVCEGQGEMPGGGTATTIMILGYDPKKECFVGTWVGSMMTHLWSYEGTLDAAGKILRLDTVGPDFAAGGKTMAKYQDIVEFRGDDHRVLTSRVLGADGQWRPIMTSNYRRKK